MQCIIYNHNNVHMHVCLHVEYVYVMYVHVNKVCMSCMLMG